jgi:hypothetical protein
MKERLDSKQKMQKLKAELILTYYKMFYVYMHEDLIHENSDFQAWGFLETLRCEGQQQICNNIIKQ